VDQLKQEREKGFHEVDEVKETRGSAPSTMNEEGRR
jgi:hypothetical protein